MLVPLSWLREHVDTPLSAEELADALTRGGLEVESITRPSAGLSGVRIGRVEGTAKVPGSDKLTHVRATDGEQVLDVICGASNFAAGDVVAWAQPGAVLPDGREIGRKAMFGITSNGMLASARELGIGEDHRGIWVLDRDAPLGADLQDWLSVDDTVLEVKVNPDRGYAASILGVARDVAALTGAELRLPEAVPADGARTDVPVTIADAPRCRRFDARRIEGVTISPSPSWLQLRLGQAGMRPISSVVDATNHAMLETGHPIHAYDLDRLAGPRIDVRQAVPGEVLVTLDGVERTLDVDDLVIADAEGPVGFAGVMGADRTEVHTGTTRLLLEVASFAPDAVSRTARRHKLFTQASSRFEKGVPAETVALGASRCAELIVATSGGRVTGAEDHLPAPLQRPSIRLRTERARRVLGLPLDDDRQRALLETIACEVSPVQDGQFDVLPPAYRPDLGMEADLWEELARLHGYDAIPETLPATGRSGARPAQDEARRAVRRALAGAGWDEVLAFPFAADTDTDALGLQPDDPRRAPIALRNPLSKTESVLQTTLLPGLLGIVRRNANRQLGDLAVFEISTVFLRPSEERAGVEGGPGGTALPAERLHLGLAAAGTFGRLRHDTPPRTADLYDLLGAVEVVREVLALGPTTVEPADELPFHPGRAARVLLSGRPVGTVGELHPRVVAALELPERTLAGELDLGLLLSSAGGQREIVVPSPLPPLRFDVAVLADESVPAATIEAAVRLGAGDRVTECRLFDVYRGPSIGEGRRSLAYALRLEASERQLTDADEAEAIEGVAAEVRKIGGDLRR